MLTTFAPSTFHDVLFVDTDLNLVVSSMLGRNSNLQEAVLLPQTKVFGGEGQKIKSQESTEGKISAAPKPHQIQL